MLSLLIDGSQVLKPVQAVAILILADSVFHCECGLERGRDFNAAINLNNYGVDALKPTAKKRTSEFSKTTVSIAT